MLFNFISATDIDTLEPVVINNQTILLGTRIGFFALVGKDGDQQQSGLTGINVRIIGISPGSEPDGPFKVDLAVPTDVEGIYTRLENVHVISLTLEDHSREETVALCNPDELDIIRVILDGKYRPNDLNS